MKEISDYHLVKDATRNECSELRIWPRLYQVSSNKVPFPATHSCLSFQPELARVRLVIKAKPGKGN